MSSSEKNKGGLKSWATAEQKVWLASRLQSYIASRSSKSPSDFWATTFEAWFQEWPHTEEGDDSRDQLRQRKSQIKDWFKNHSRASGSTGERRRKLLDFGHKKPKKLPLWQAYSKRYYEEKLKDVVQERWIIKYKTENPEEESEEQRTKIPNPPLRFRNEVIRNLYEEESEEVKNEVEAFRDKLRMNDSGTIDDDGVGPEENERRKIAATYQSNINALQPTMASILEEIQEKTGFVGMVLLAGPEPGQGGNISVLEFHRGRSVSGNDFSVVYKDYIANIRKPFHNFACGIFPPATRSARALVGTEYLANYTMKPEIDSHPTLPSSGSSDLGDTPVRPSDMSKSKHRRVPDSDDDTDDDNNDDDEESASSMSEGDSEHVIQWSPSPKPGEPSDVATTQKRKALEEQLQRLNQLEAKAAAKKRKLQGKRSVKSKVSQTTDSITTTPPSANATSTLPSANATSTLPSANATSTPPSAHTTPTLPSTNSTPMSARSNAVPAPTLPAPTLPSSPIPSQAEAASELPFHLGGKVPSWLQPHLPELESSYASPEMRDLVRNLPILDELLGYPTSKRSALLPSVGRPYLISVWIAGGRRAPPKIDDPRDFAQTWKAWWKSLQPSLRAITRFSKLPRAIGPDDNWETLQKAGINGFFTIVASLSWWFAEVKTDSQRKDFNNTVSDVLWAQEQVIASLRGSSDAQVMARSRRSARA